MKIEDLKKTDYKNFLSNLIEEKKDEFFTSKELIKKLDEEGIDYEYKLASKYINSNIPKIRKPGSNYCFYGNENIIEKVKEFYEGKDK